MSFGCPRRFRLGIAIHWKEERSAMIRSVVLTFCIVVIASFTIQAAFGQDQFIDCRKFANNIQITIDGNPNDWPLNSYGSPALMPDIDEAEQFSDTASSNALDLVPMTTGDHFVFDPKKVLISAGGLPSFEAEGEGDFAATTYIGWNDTGLYLLNVVQDSKIGWAHGQAEDRDIANNPAWTNDGIEMWFDTDNDRLPPNIDSDQTSENDLQFDFSIDDAVIKEEFDTDPVMGNGLPLDIAIFRSALNTEDDAEIAILEKIIHKTQLDSKPKGEHTSYVQEIMFPWNVFPNLESTHPIGFNINWVDWDDKVFQLMRWSQGNESDVQYYRELRFTSNNPLGAAAVEQWSIQ